MMKNMNFYKNDVEGKSLKYDIRVIDKFYSLQLVFKILVDIHVCLSVSSYSILFRNSKKIVVP